jgi:hypothetical protein
MIITYDRQIYFNCIVYICNESTKCLSAKCFLSKSQGTNRRKNTFNVSYVFHANLTIMRRNEWQSPSWSNFELVEPIGGMLKSFSPLARGGGPNKDATMARWSWNTP